MGFSDFELSMCIIYLKGSIIAYGNLNKTAEYSRSY